ncbi:MAG: hypothetical protein CL946_01980 [Ectothiorhodospiraceae bacterium]|nr:hypothetical protein [Ectothiorhodospiraceae bacterium]
MIQRFLQACTVIATTALLLLAFQRCSDDTPTEPPPPTQKDTTSHTFIWEVDTLFRPGTNFPAFFTAEAIYATSATNVYMVGYSTDHNICWHWAGSEWTSINVGDYLAGDIVDIDGVDSTYIVMAGRDYGGTRYSSMGVFNNGYFETLPIPLGDKWRTCVHVAARDEIYLGSVQGVQRYNGTEWEWLLDSTETIGNEFYPVYIHKFQDGTLELVSQKNANALSNIVRWTWEDQRFVVVDSFPTEIRPFPDNRFGYSIHESGSDVFSTGLDKTFKRSGSDWVKIHDVGGIYLSGSMNNLIIGSHWTYFWHYNGSTMKNLWSEISALVPRITMINAVTFIDGVLFVCAEYDQSSRDVVVLRGRQVKSE